MEDVLQWAEGHTYALEFGLEEWKNREVDLENNGDETMHKNWLLELKKDICETM